MKLFFFWIAKLFWGNLHNSQSGCTSYRARLQQPLCGIIQKIQWTGSNFLQGLTTTTTTKVTGGVDHCECHFLQGLTTSGSGIGSSGTKTTEWLEGVTLTTVSAKNYSSPCEVVSYRILVLIYDHICHSQLWQIILKERYNKCYGLPHDNLSLFCCFNFISLKSAILIMHTFSFMVVQVHFYS